MNDKSIKSVELIGAIIGAIVFSIIIGLCLIFVSAHVVLHPFAIYLTAVVVSTLGSILGIAIIRSEE